MIKQAIHPLIPCAAALGLFTSATDLRAQQPPTPGEGVLDEIIVTAQKRAERLQDVPVSVSVIGAESLQAGQKLRLEDYYAEVPGLAVNTGSGGHMTLAIRGITTGGANQPTVGVTIDDVPIGSSAGFTYASLLAADIDPSMLERVEVLRGPQGTIYGASSLGGLLRYVTKKPEMNLLSGRLQVDGLTVDGGGDGYALRGAGNIPLVTDRLAATVSGFVRQDPGYVDDPAHSRRDVNSADVWGGRVSTLWEISDNASLRVSALYQNAEGDGSPDVEANTALQPVSGELAHDRLPRTGIYERKIQQYDATLEIDLGWSLLTSVTGYNVSDSMDARDVTNFLGSLTEAATGRDDLGSTTFIPSKTSKFSQELRLSSTGDRRLEWLVGAFYTDEDSDVAYNIYGVDPETGAPEILVFPDHFPSTLEETALFGAVTWHFSDRFDVQVGSRFSKNEQVFDEHIGGPLYDPPYTVHAESDDSSTTYLFSPRFRFSDELMLYGRVATGYRPGGPNPGAGFGFPDTFGPDDTLSYEIGVKGELLARRLSIDVSAYHIKWSDLQLQQRDPATEFVYYTNAGKARSQGLEAIAQAVLWDGMSLRASLGYTDAELREPTDGGIIGDAGDRLPYSADWTASLSLDKQFPVSSEVDAVIGGSVAYVGDRFAAFSSSPLATRAKLPSYTTLGLQAGLEFSGWTATAFVHNLTDERGILRAEPEIVSGATGVYILNVIRPRTFGLSLTRKF